MLFYTVSQEAEYVRGLGGIFIRHGLVYVWLSEIFSKLQTSNPHQPYPQVDRLELILETDHNFVLN